MSTSIVKIPQFIQAIRDAGYRDTSSALAELVDNAIEANATRVDIKVLMTGETEREGYEIYVADNGCGMTAGTLQIALQFGGSTRFNKRRGTGRFGMGLPNSSVSQARRLDVYSWNSPGSPLWSYLDVDEIKDGELGVVPKPKKRVLPEYLPCLSKKHGTVVFLSRCDRLSHKRLSTLIRKLKLDIGRIFRSHLWKNCRINVNGETVEPIDPLFLREGANKSGAKIFGQELNYDFSVAGNGHSSKVRILFTELPVKKWADLPNKEKQAAGITKGAGVSILRAGREIDYGWFLMGTKRRENYDDWWRCEIEFQPDLDELFGVTHTKQGIRPSEELQAQLAPDLERAALDLNARVRDKFLAIKNQEPKPNERKAEDRDIYLEPLAPLAVNNKAKRSKTKAAPKLKYRQIYEALNTDEMFLPQLEGNTLKMKYNADHPFIRKFLQRMQEVGKVESELAKEYVELLLISLGRAEIDKEGQRQAKVISKFRQDWSKVATAFLE